MNTYFKNGFLLLFFTIILSCSKENSTDQSTEKGLNIDALSIKVSNLPQEDLSEAEKLSLEIMREEEGLAYQVYIKLYEKWGNVIFNNIAQNSENSHLQAVKLLLDKYNIGDPYPIAQLGVFKNAKIQKLYDDFIIKGNQSELDAIKIGCEIEELDISDLNNYLKITNNQDLKIIYDLLNLGSRNHLRSFYKNLIKFSGQYTPKYLSESEYTTIINSEKEVSSY